MSKTPTQVSLSDLDLYLIAEGRHEDLWNVLGAQVVDSDANGEHGVQFAVWAPHAREVRVIGDFNFWGEGDEHVMRQRAGSGIWELFVPGLESGVKYKYRIRDAAGAWHKHADPLARFAETAPSTASIVYKSTHEWQDDDWLKHRAERLAVNAPMSTYELHLNSWRHGRSYRDLANELVSYVTGMGFTHVEFMPVMQHPYGGSWGYHITGYYAPDSRLGTPDDFRYLIDRLHQAGIGVILDWVPGHFATDEWALAKFDGTALYEHPDPRRGWHQDWGSFIFDFGRPQVRNFLYSNALYWLEEFHADGLRVDGVASMLYLDYSRADGQWLPNIYGGRENLEAVELLQTVNATAYRRNPDIVMIAEESTAWPGVTAPTDHDGLGFGFKWNMGWMHDSLDYIGREPIHRKYHHGTLTHLTSWAWSENYILPLSHDEVVHGKRALLQKMPGDRWQQFANLRSYYAFQWAFPGKHLLFMGSEFAQTREWAHEGELDWWLLDDNEEGHAEHVHIQQLVQTLNSLYRATPAMWQRDNDPSAFRWIIEYEADRNVIAFARTDNDGNEVVCLVNFSPEVYDRSLLTDAGFDPTGWHVILNTDDMAFGGSNVQPPDLIPPLAAVWFKRD